MKADRSLAVLILLSIITCGIYGIYFWYMYTEDINTACEGDGNESPNYIIVILLSIITCGIYEFYWFYKQGNRLWAIAQNRYNFTIQENGTTVLLWMLLGALLCGIGTFIAMHILIKNMNSVAIAYNSTHSIPSF